MTQNNKVYFSTKFSSLIGDGGGHSCKSAILEAIDNSKDAFKKSNREIPIPYIIIALSFVRNVLAIFDPMKGAEDIRTLWGGGDISIKPADCMGKKMTGNLAADLYFVPETILYFSHNPIFQIPWQFAKLDVKEMRKTLNEEPNMRLADAKFNDHFEVQAQKNLKKLHDEYLEQIKIAIGNHPAICDLIDSKATMFGKIIIGGEGNRKFTLLEKDFEKTINEILQSYNEVIRRGLEIRVINLDNNGSTQIFNAETAQAYHILGTESVVEEPTQGVAVFESPDFGPIDLNRVHCFEINKFNDNGQIVVDYKNFDKKIKCDQQQLSVLQGLELADYNFRKNDDQIQKTTCRVTLAVLSKTERDIQTKSIKSDADELRKISIGINTGDGIRILARLDYPADWPGVAPRNLKNVAIVIAFNGEDKFISLSANKSNITWSNIDSTLLNVLKETVLKIIKQYSYTIWKTDNGESRILASSEKFIAALGLQNNDIQPDAIEPLIPLPNPVPAPQPPRPRARPRTKQEILLKLNEMTAQEVSDQYQDIDEIIKNNLGKITPSRSREILKLLLADVEDNTIILKGSQLFN
jgi:hypothetical protein